MSNEIICDCDTIHEEVVKRVKEKMPTDNEFRLLSELYKVYADSTRSKILYALLASEMCVCDLAVLLNMTKSAISHQLGFLRESNLVINRKSGKIVYYSLSDDCSREILKLGFKHIKE